MTDPLKVAILGYWHVHARDYAANAAANPDTEVVAVWDDDLGRGRAGADAWASPSSRISTRSSRAPSSMRSSSRHRPSSTTM